MMSQELHNGLRMNSNYIDLWVVDMATHLSINLFGFSVTHFDASDRDLNLVVNNHWSLQVKMEAHKCKRIEEERQKDTGTQPTPA